MSEGVFTAILGVCAAISVPCLIGISSCADAIRRAVYEARLFHGAHPRALKDLQNMPRPRSIVDTYYTIAPRWNRWFLNGVLVVVALALIGCLPFIIDIESETTKWALQGVVLTVCVILVVVTAFKYQRVREYTQKVDGNFSRSHGAAPGA